MKTPLYIVACLGIGAAGAFSWNKIAEHQAELDATNDLKQRTVRVQNAYTAKQKDYEAETVLKDEAIKELELTSAELGIKEASKQALEGDLAALNKKIASQKRDLQEINDLIQKVRDTFADENLALEEVPDFIKSLTKKRKDLEAKSEELAITSEELQSRVDNLNQDLDGMRNRDAERVASLNQNGYTSLITAVNPSWGFVIIQPHPKAQIADNSDLIIVRGTEHIGRLRISAIEPNRVIADIDMDSLADGATVRAGDRVILAKANSR